MNMSIAENQQEEKNKRACFSDYVTNVPDTIINKKRYIAYNCLQLLGSGSYSKCFEVVRKSTGEHFACKILSKVMVQDIHLKRLVQNEINIHFKLNHEHVVAFIDSFNDENHIYMIQSLCLNHSLRDLLKHRGVVQTNECRYFIQQILKGVQYIHKMRIIHRDLKLGNILIDENMQMKIGDFGLAIECDSPRMQSKSLCGTTNYLAPEVVNRKGFVLCSDIWAVGVIAYVLLFGYTPFEEYDATETYNRIVRVDYYLPADLDDDARHFFKSVLEKDLTRRPNAENSLKLPFFSKYIIPPTLPDDIWNLKCVDQPKRIPNDPTSIFHVTSAMASNVIQFTYPDIVVVAQPKITNSIENLKYALMLERVHRRFDTVCRFQESRTDITEMANSKPNYWIGKWFLDFANGIVYQISDKSVGMLFNDGLRMTRTPDRKYWISDSGRESFHNVYSDDGSIKSELKEDFKKFRELKYELKKKGYFEAETSFIHDKSPYLYTWFQTNEAMVMLLSNNTFQINFAKSHKKMLICPENETITLANGKLTRNNFKTVGLATLATQRFSANNFQMLKYVTASLKLLSTKLKKAVKESNN